MFAWQIKDAKKQSELTFDERLVYGQSSQAVGTLCREMCWLQKYLQVYLEQFWGSCEEQRVLPDNDDNNKYWSNIHCC